MPYVPSSSPLGASKAATVSKNDRNKIKTQNTKFQLRACITRANAFEINFVIHVGLVCDTALSYP